MPKPAYTRILLKLSGEILMGRKSYGIDPPVIRTIAEEIKEIRNVGVEVGVVIGGGNIFRGMAASRKGMDRASADYMGMLATCMNALALQDVLEGLEIKTRVLTAIKMDEIAEPFVRRRAIRHLEKGRVVIFSAGTGNPYFTTDTAAALRANEINANVLLKGTKVNGVYSGDPQKRKNVRFFRKLTYLSVLRKRLRIMDSTAISLCMENNIPIIIFNIKKRGNLLNIIFGKQEGTIVKGDTFHE